MKNLVLTAVAALSLAASAAQAEEIRTFPFWPIVLECKVLEGQSIMSALRTKNVSEDEFDSLVSKCQNLHETLGTERTFEASEVIKIAENVFLGYVPTPTNFVFLVMSIE